MKQEIELAGPPNVFRYRPCNDYSLDELENNYIHFSNTDSLNDPFDSHPELIKLTDNETEINEFYNLINSSIPDKLTQSYFQRKFTSESLKDFVQENIGNFIKEFGIACFSINPLNMPLWGNYASNNRGLCLQFNADLDLDFFNGLRIVQYEKNLIQKEFKPISNKREIIDLFFRKQENWHYEYEVRLLKNFKGRYQFKKESLRNVIFGYQTEVDFMEKAIQIVKQNYKHTKTYQMQRPTEMKTISFIEL